MADLHDSYERLYEILQAHGDHDSCVRLTSLAWTAHEAPEEGLRIAREAAEQLKRGRCLDEDPVRDAVKNFLLCGECQRRTHFALESTLRYLHATGDIVSQVVNDGLDLGIDEGRCSLPAVIRGVSKEGVWSGIADALHRLKCSDDYRYVADATNHMKHQNALQSSVGARVTEDDDIDVRQCLTGFQHNHELYDAAEAAEIRLGVVDMQSLIGDVLVELARCLK